MLKRHKTSNKSIIILNIFILLTGLILLSYKDVSRLYIHKTNLKNIEMFFNKEVTNNYIGVLEIPKINLKQGFYDIDNSLNNVDKNISLIDMNTNDNGYLVLASHSGNSNISYFKNLNKLEYNDIAYIYYNDIKYTYKLTNYYAKLKDNSITINKESSINNLVLITCVDNEYQMIYIFDLNNKQYE